MSKDNKKIATLWDKKGSDDDEHPGRGQAFYAGGSEHSGQQILGPNRDSPNQSDHLVENLFRHARQSAALVSDPNDPAQSGSGSTSTLPVIFWRNGFTIGEDGELREYLAPENRQFLEYLQRGETPPELANRMRGGIIDVKLENRKHEDHKFERKLQAFSGEGHRLGAPSPETISSDQTQPVPTSSSTSNVQSSLIIDESQPNTTIQVRLVDNSRMVVRANLSNRVGDIVSHIRAIRPQYSESNFVLATTFPAKELTDLDQSVEEAKLANASVLQKMKR